MLNKNTSMGAFETVLMKLIFKQKKFIYDIGRLEYKIWLALNKLEIVNALIEEEEQNIANYTAAILAVKQGKVYDQLTTLKIKAEYKLFRLNLRKKKIDITKLIINQSKLEQTRQALGALNEDINKIKNNTEDIEKPDLNKLIKTGLILSFNENKNRKQVKHKIDMYSNKKMRKDLKAAS